MHASEIGNLDIFKLIRALATLSTIGIGNVAKIANRHVSETGNLDYFFIRTLSTSTLVKLATLIIF